MHSEVQKATYPSRFHHAPVDLVDAVARGHQRVADKGGVRAERSDIGQRHSEGGGSGESFGDHLDLVLVY